MGTHNFRELDIWKRSLELSRLILRRSLGFPSEHKFGLTSQLLKSAVSIPSNIAEGSARGTNRDFARFLDIALGSAYELETQLFLSEEFAYFSKEEIELIYAELHEIERMIQGFKRSLFRNK